MSSQAVCEHCSKPLGALPASAPHKRFCSRLCRETWNSEERKRALAALRESESTSGTTSQGHRPYPAKEGKQQ